MGFSSSLNKNAVSEWRDFYIDYDTLYGKLKHSSFKKMLEEELQKVNNFYFLLEKKAVDEKDNIFSDILSNMPADDLKKILRGAEDIEMFRVSKKKSRPKPRRTDSDDVAISESDSLIKKSISRSFSNNEYQIDHINKSQESFTNNHDTIINKELFYSKNVLENNSGTSNVGNNKDDISVEYKELENNSRTSNIIDKELFYNKNVAENNKEPFYNKNISENNSGTSGMKNNLMKKQTKPVEKSNFPEIENNIQIVEGYSYKKKNRIATSNSFEDIDFSRKGHPETIEDFKKKIKDDTFNNDVSATGAFERRKKEKNLTEFLYSLIKIISFRDLNATGMLKLAKKYTDMRRKSQFYRRFSEKLKDSYFYKSKRIEAIRRAVKHLYRQVFAKNEPEKARTVFRRIKKGSESSDWLFILSGAFVGITYTLSIANNNLYRSEGYWAVANIYLGFLLFGICLKIFKAIKVNYKFIFNFDVCSNMNNSLYLLTVSSLFLVNAFAFILAEMFQVKWILVLLLLQISIFFIPADVLFYNSRLYLLGAYGRAIFQPFSTIRFRHFYFIDIAQSFSYSIKHILIMGGVSNDYIIFFSQTLSTFIRIMQCIKRYSMSKLRFPHLFNCFKFLTSILYNVMKSMKPSEDFQLEKLLIFVGIINSTFGLLWDIFVDWIIRRERYMYPKGFYYSSIVFDILARFMWIVLSPRKYPISTNIVEIIRRFLWTLIRVEVEHLNNCDMLRNKNAINLTAGELFYKKNQNKINESMGMTEDERSNNFLNRSIDDSTQQSEYSGAYDQTSDINDGKRSSQCESEESQYNESLNSDDGYYKNKINNGRYNENLNSDDDYYGNKFGKSRRNDSPYNESLNSDDDYYENKINDSFCNESISGFNSESEITKVFENDTSCETTDGINKESSGVGFRGDDNYEDLSDFEGEYEVSRSESNKKGRKYKSLSDENNDFNIDKNNQ